MQVVMRLVHYRGEILVRLDRVCKSCHKFIGWWVFRFVALVHDLQEPYLLRGAVGHPAPRALLALLALLYHLLDQSFPQEMIRGAASQLRNEATPNVLRQQDATALLADAS